MRAAVFWLLCAACCEGPDPQELSDCLSDGRDPVTMSGQVRTTIGVLPDPCDSVDLLVSEDVEGRYRSVVCWLGPVHDATAICRWERP